MPVKIRRPVIAHALNPASQRANPAVNRPIPGKEGFAVEAESRSGERRDVALAQELPSLAVKRGKMLFGFEVVSGGNGHKCGLEPAQGPVRMNARIGIANRRPANNPSFMQPLPATAIANFC
jgi:hypothetical protein